MKFAVVFAATAKASNPVSKVLELLGGLEVKITNDDKAEEAEFTKFVRFCETNAKQLQRELNDSSDRVAQLKAAIEKASADIESDTASISDLSAVIAEAESDLKEAEAVRAKQFAQYSSRAADLSETVDSLGHTISKLKTANSEISSQAAGRVSEALEMLLQAGAIGTADRSRLQALMQSREEDQDRVTYQAHGGVDSVIDVFNDMLEKAETQQGKVQREESKAAHAHAMMATALKEKIESASTELDDTKHHKAAAEEDKANGEGDLKVATTDMNADQSSLSSLQTDCMVKASDHQSNVDDRKEDLKALAAAKKIILEKTGAAADRAYSFLQLKSRADDFSEVVSALKTLSKQNKDFSLSLLSSQVTSTVKSAAASGADPFAKVKGLIQDMIEKLVEEGKKEADAKAYCDKEMKDTKEKKEGHESDIDKLSGKINKLESSIARVTSDITTLEADLGHIANMQKELNDNRAAEREEYDAQVRDYKQGIEGIQMAIKVMKEYYGKSSLLQSATEAGNAGTSIIGILEVAESDFTKLLAEADGDDKEAQNYYDQTTQQNEVDKAEKKTALEYKKKEQAETKNELEELRGDRDSEQGELDAVLEYSAKIKKQCVAKPEPYEERKRRREAEMEGLKNALDILEGNGLGFLSLKAVRRHM
jgi:chromosome segregation ATPase